MSSLCCTPQQRGPEQRGPDPSSPERSSDRLSGERNSKLQYQNDREAHGYSPVSSERDVLAAQMGQLDPTQAQAVLERERASKAMSPEARRALEQVDLAQETLPPLPSGGQTAA